MVTTNHTLLRPLINKMIQSLARSLAISLWLCLARGMRSIMGMVINLYKCTLHSASSPGLCILRRQKTKAWYTLFTHAYNFNQKSVKPLSRANPFAVYVTVTKWPMVLTTCPLSEIPSLPKFISYALQRCV